MIPIPHAAENQASDCQGTMKRWWSSVPFACSAFFAVCCILFTVTIFIPMPLAQRCFGPKSTDHGNLAIAFVVSPVMHADLFHLAFNMMALVGVGSTMERDRLGTGGFFGLCISIAYACNVAFFGEAWAISAAFPSTVNSCVLGFSAVIFGLIAYDAHDPMMSHVPNRSYSLFGCVQVPALYFPWVMLALTFFLFPGSSFLGHLNGVLLGIGAAKFVSPSVFTSWEGIMPGPWRHSAKYCTPDAATRAGREPQSGWLAPGGGDAGSAGGDMTSVLNGFKEKASGALGGGNTREPFSGRGRTCGTTSSNTSSGSQGDGAQNQIL